MGRRGHALLHLEKQVEKLSCCRDQCLSITKRRYMAEESSMVPVSYIHVFNFAVIFREAGWRKALVYLFNFTFITNVKNT